MVGTSAFKGAESAKFGLIFLKSERTVLVSEQLLNAITFTFAI